MSAYKISSVIRTYRWRSVFFSYCWRLCLLILIIVIPYNIIMYNYYSSTLNQSIISSTQESMNQARNLLDLFTSEFQTSYSMISAHGSTRIFLSTPESRLSDIDGDIRMLQAYLKRVVDGSSAIMDASLYSDASGYVLSSDLLLPSDVARKTPSMDWLNTYRATQLPFLMVPRKTAGSSSFDSLYVTMQILEGNRYKGVFFLRVRYDYFENMVNSSVTPAPSALYILNNVGVVLYSTDPAMINRPLFYYRDIESDYARVRDSASRIVVGPDAVHFVSSSDDSYMTLYSVLNPENFSPPLNRRMMTLTSLVVVLLSLAVSFFMSVRMYRSIVDMIALVQDPYRKPNPASTMGEFLYISESITDTALKNRVITKELHKSLEELKESQSIALQSQINPHFLFNTLQMVNLSILRECRADNDAVRIVGLLSDLMRCAFDNSRTFISVEEELDYADKYLQIQRIRYKNRLRVDIQADEEAYSCQTLKMLCQPLIENCIMHGLMPKADDWLITVRCHLTGDRLFFEIRDNGVGMSEEKLRSLRDKIQQNDLARDRNIGLANVSMRLRLLFADRYTLHIDSQINKGTVITLTHPVL